LSTRGFNFEDRNVWAKRVAELLVQPGSGAKGGQLMALEYPHTSTDPLIPDDRPYRLDENTLERHFRNSNAEHVYDQNGIFVESRGVKPGDGDIGLKLVERFEVEQFCPGPNNISVWKLER